ncbi:MAG: PAS domain-containing protein [Acidobacteria bacterium]|nr:PAS domain-containing protein [Acidobacteriota bacterium]
MDKENFFQKRLFTKIAAVLAILVSSFVMAGWIFDIDILKSVVPGLVSMKVNTAICFSLVGTSLYLEQERFRNNKYISHISLLLIIATVFITIATLFQYLSGYDLGIDQLIVKETSLDARTSHLGRMSPITAISFLFVAGSLYFSRSKNKYSIYLSQVFALIFGQIALICLISYVYGAELSYGISRFTQIAIHTVITFIFIFFGVFFLHPNQAIASIITSNHYGTFLACRLLPFAILIPFVFGFLRLVGERMGFYGTTFGITLYCSSTIAILVLAILWQSSILNKLDIDRKNKEIALRESEQRLQAILDNSTAIIFLKDLEGRFLLINKQFEKMFLIARQELIGKTVYDFFPKKLADCYTDNDLQAIKEGKAIEYEEDALQNGEEHTYLAIKFPLYNPQGDVYGLAGISTDITQRKQIEKELKNTKEKLEEIVKERTRELAETNKKLRLEAIENKKSQEEIKKLNENLEKRVIERTKQLETINKELEAFSYSVSHDLRAPLRHISGFIELLKKNTNNNLSEKGQHYIKVISEASKKMGVLIDELLSFSRMGRSELRNANVDLEKMVEKLVKSYQESLKDRKITWCIEKLPIVQADSAMLELVFNNLISNALKYSGKKSETKIEIGIDLTSNNRTEEVIIFVRDNGVGFDMQYVDKLFGVFQRLHKTEEFEGIGIGLANVRRIINRHGGRTWAESFLGQGATFYFSLPKNGEKNE